ncbi:D-glucuronyl C5-epimerase B-like isoform X3 [Amphibalanus amphitrite]|uniref:D-glucuronyl C5-epimerase B-like isoform X3 n=1 Tax=Amphibalanus amphitrite TaxID=1232801 RepID=UPI001C902DC1|nr:D-glucuronyl C5-epimerase B-like isoform X3 [Amphibalanus amphitrite]
MVCLPFGCASTKRMRWWARSAALFATIILLLFSLSFWNRCGGEPGPPSTAAPADSLTKRRQSQLNHDTEGNDLTDLRCDINEEYSIDCKKSGKEVYIPFKFIKKYFEVYGQLSEQHGQPVFHWSHSYGQLFPPEEPYRPDGQFMYFATYNVEKRDRVKCISGPEGVPVTTQWRPSGFFYVIQIAQFGLSHYSRNLTEPPPNYYELLPSRNGASSGATFSWVRDSELNEDVAEFSPANPVTIPVDRSGKSLLMLELQVSSNATVWADLQFRDTALGRSVRVHYVCSDLMIAAQGSDVFVGLGSSWSGYKLFIRDLTVDALKGLGGRGRNAPKLTAQRLRVVRLGVSGGGRLRQLRLASSAHAGQTVQAADWLLRHQTAAGAWTVPVERRLNNHMVLAPDWSSAMAQGQAMSLLTRVYRATGDRRYLDAARRAAAPFNKDSADGGVRTMFQDKYVWYEEYPTVPASMVLNGFIYSLMGLYDLWRTDPDPAGGGAEAGRLYTAGVSSLRALLPLYDTGSGTLYDLRHVTCHVAPNLARWDYHVTHVNQLLVLATMEPNVTQFSTTADRWAEYMSGHRAPHN